VPVKNGNSYNHECKQLKLSLVKLGGWFVISLLIIVADQLSKAWIVSTFAYLETTTLLPVLQITHVYNYGAAFSFLSDQSGWQRWFFVSLSSLASIVLVVWIMRTPLNKKWLLTALTFILGGAIGNLIDRATLGYVVDFISVHYQHHYFPAFNVADSAITVGAIMLFIDMWLEPNEKNVN
jgi:signal peptidase II